MYTFIELQGFSKRRQALLPDDEFRFFQEMLIEWRYHRRDRGISKNSLEPTGDGQAWWGENYLLQCDA